MAKNLNFRISAVVIVVVVLAGAFFILNRPETGATRQSTDDAYVQADFTVVAPQLAGVISHMAVEENQPVSAGEPLVNIDDRDMRIAVDTARATVASLRAQLERQKSTIAQANAAVNASVASLTLADANRSRFANLARDGSGTVQSKQQAETQWNIQRAKLESDRAGLRAAEQQVAILQAELDRANTALSDANLKLSYTRISAPVSGVVAQKAARVGSYVHIGESLLTLVPLDAVYIEAHFRETQIAHMQAGQPVEITVDALPDVQLKGRVESLGPASGVSFSTVPPHNATGNFTKIVQRLPVRIYLEPDQADTRKLRVGMSVRPVINVGASTNSDHQVVP